MIIVLVGNFKDREDQREVTVQMAEEFRLKHKILLRIESSAKTGENVDQIFIMAAKILYNNYKDKIKVLVSTSPSHLFRKSKPKIKRRLGRGSGKVFKQKKLAAVEVSIMCVFTI